MHVKASCIGRHGLLNGRPCEVEVKVDTSSRVNTAGHQYLCREKKTWREMPVMSKRSSLALSTLGLAPVASAFGPDHARDVIFASLILIAANKRPLYSFAKPYWKSFIASRISVRMRRP